MTGEWSIQNGKLILWINYDKPNQTSSGTSGCSIVASAEVIGNRPIEEVQKISLLKASKLYNIRNLKFKN